MTTVNYIPAINFYNYSDSDIIRLHMLSGGNESCAALIQDLKETKHQIHCHHIILQNNENRHEAESKAVKHIIEYCRKHYRNFVFSSNTFSWQKINTVEFSPKDSFIVNFVAGGIALSIHKALSMDGFESKNIELVATQTYDELYPVTFVEYKQMESFKVFELTFKNFFYNSKIKPEIIYPFINMTKNQVREMIPEELRQYIVSCRNPQKIDDDFIDCGICKPCKLLRGIK